MITVYDLESFSTIEADEVADSRAMPADAPASELRLQLVAESSSHATVSPRDFSSVIAAQALANISA